eukprot:gene15125-21180_t
MNARDRERFIRSRSRGDRASRRERRERAREPGERDSPRQPHKRNSPATARQALQARKDPQAPAPLQHRTPQSSPRQRQHPPAAGTGSSGRDRPPRNPGGSSPPRKAGQPTHTATSRPPPEAPGTAPHGKSPTRRGGGRKAGPEPPARRTAARAPHGSAGTPPHRNHQGSHSTSPGTHNGSPANQRIDTLVATVLFTIDIIVMASAAYILQCGNSRKLVTKGSSVLYFYTFKDTLILDALVTIPWFISTTIVISRGYESSGSTLVQFIRLLRFYRLYGVLKEMLLGSFLTRFNNLRVNVSLLYMFALLYVSAVLISLFGCIWYFVGDKGTDHWYESENSQDPDADPPNAWVFYAGALGDITKDSRARQYITIWYYMVTTLTTVGYGDIYAHNTREQIVAMVIQAVAAFFFGSLIGGVVSITTKSGASAKRAQLFINKIRGVMEFLDSEAVSSQWKKKIIFFYRSQWLWVEEEHAMGDTCSTSTSTPAFIFPLTTASISIVPEVLPQPMVVGGGGAFYRSQWLWVEEERAVWDTYVDGMPPKMICEILGELIGPRLHQLEPFIDLQDYVINKLAGSLSYQPLTPESVIITQGEAATHVWFIEEGDAVEIHNSKATERRIRGPALNGTNATITITEEDAVEIHNFKETKRRIRGPALMGTKALLSLEGRDNGEGDKSSYSSGSRCDDGPLYPSSFKTTTSCQAYYLDVSILLLLIKTLDNVDATVLRLRLLDPGIFHPTGRTCIATLDPPTTVQRSPPQQVSSPAYARLGDTSGTRGPFSSTPTPPPPPQTKSPKMIAKAVDRSASSIYPAVLAGTPTEFPIKPEELIAKAKALFYEGESGVKDPSLLSDEFRFEFPVVSLTKKKFVEAVSSFKLLDAFPNMDPHAYDFRVDPYEPNRVWFTCRSTAVHTGNLKFFGTTFKPTNKVVYGAPECMSYTFDTEGKCTAYTGGYVMDRRVGNTQGLGAMFGILAAIGGPVLKPGSFAYISLFARAAFSAVAGGIFNLLTFGLFKKKEE